MTLFLWVGNMLNELELELVRLFAYGELNILQPHPIKDKHPDYKIYTYFNSSLNKMKFGRQCLIYSAVRKEKGFTIKDLTCDLKISEVAVRDIVKTCVKEGWIDEIVGTTHFTMSEYSMKCYVNYIQSKIEHDQARLQRMANLVTTVYTFRETNN